MTKFLRFLVLVVVSIGAGNCLGGGGLTFPRRLGSYINTAPVYPRLTQEVRVNDANNTERALPDNGDGRNEVDRNASGACGAKRPPGSMLRSGHDSLAPLGISAAIQPNYLEVESVDVLNFFAEDNLDTNVLTDVAALHDPERRLAFFELLGETLSTTLATAQAATKAGDHITADQFNLGATQLVTAAAYVAVNPEPVLSVFRQGHGGDGPSTNASEPDCRFTRFVERYALPHLPQIIADIDNADDPEVARVGTVMGCRETMVKRFNNGLIAFRDGDNDAGIVAWVNAALLALVIQHVDMKACFSGPGRWVSPIRVQAGSR
jgi:hypothetical protein